MTKKQFVVADQEGLHARNAAAIARSVMDAQAKGRLSCNGKEARADNIVELMGLCAVCGDRIEVMIDGGVHEAGILEAIEHALAAQP